MSNTVLCPGCKSVIKITEPIAEDEAYVTECLECGKAVRIAAHIMITHTASCIAGQCNMVAIKNVPYWFQCSMCGSMQRLQK